MEYSVAKITITKPGQAKPAKVGTCYFLTRDTVATCFHVIEDVYYGDGGPDKWGAACKITFNPAGEVKEFRDVENLLGFDEVNDIAILRLKTEIKQAEPVDLRFPNNTLRRSDWAAIGYPASAKGQRQTLVGDYITVTSVLADVSKISFIAPQALGGRLGGFSGAPVFVEGEVVGHLTDNTVNDNGVNDFGTIYAVSSDLIYPLVSQVVENYDKYIDIVVFETGEFYIKRGVESIISEKLLKTGQGVLLTGYLKSGKTHTLKFFETITDAFADYENDSGRIVIVNLSIDLILPFVGKGKMNLDTVFCAFCEELRKKLKRAKIGFNEVLEWEELFTTAVNVTNWFGKVFRFFEDKQKRLMLFIDDAGRLFSEITPEENNEFFRILRSLLVEQRDYFGLLVAYTSTSALTDSIPVQLLNMYYPIDFDDFTEDEIAMFGNKFCKDHSIIRRDEFLCVEQLKKIKEEIAGNPWMLILFFSKLRELSERIGKFNFAAEFEKTLPDKRVYNAYLQTLQTLIPADLKDEIPLFDGVDWTEAAEPPSRENRRRELVKMGILQEKAEDEYNRYKLRCNQFKNIAR